MAGNSINNILIPNISKISNKANVDKIGKKEGDLRHAEFEKLLKGKVDSLDNQKSNNYGVKVSGHAVKRLRERNLDMDTSEYFKLRGAIDKLKAKGGRESLVITNNAAYIVDVKNDKIVTAIDKENMAENVFTKIDSTLFIN